MSKLTDKLRQFPLHHGIEAAEEIEMLERELHQVRAKLDAISLEGPLSYANLQRENASMKAKIEKLLALDRPRVDKLNRLNLVNARLDEELVELRAKLTEQVEYMNAEHGALLDTQDEVVRLEAKLTALEKSYREELDKVSIQNYELRKEAQGMHTKLMALEKQEPIGEIVDDPYFEGVIRTIKPLREYGVGTIARMGKRQDGEPWHYARFNESDIDLPPGTPIFAKVEQDEEKQPECCANCEKFTLKGMV